MVLQSRLIPQLYLGPLFRWIRILDVHCILKFQDNLLYETIKDLTEDFSFPNLNYMLAPNPPEKKMSLDNGETTSSFPSKRIQTEDALPTGDIPNPRFYTGHILYIYNNVVKVF